MPAVNLLMEIGLEEGFCCDGLKEENLTKTHLLKLHFLNATINLHITIISF